jgi:hypothetical protein
MAENPPPPMQSPLHNMKGDAIDDLQTMIEGMDSSPNSSHIRLPSPPHVMQLIDSIPGSNEEENEDIMEMKKFAREEFQNDHSTHSLDDFLKHTNIQSGKKKVPSRMSIAEMKDALKHLQERNWSDKHPTGHINLDTLETSINNHSCRKVIMSAIYHLETQHKMVTMENAAHYFILWRRHTELASFVDANTGSDDANNVKIASDDSNSNSSEVVQSSVYNAYKRLQVENVELEHQSMELKKVIDEDTDIPRMKAIGAKNIIMIYVKQSLRRRLEFGFQHWLWITDRVVTQRALQRETLLLKQESQKLMAKEFQLGHMLAVNGQLSNAITCSHAFFRWKVNCIKSIFLEEREKEMNMQRSVFNDLTQLKQQLYEKNKQNEISLKNTYGCGRNIIGKMKFLENKVDICASLTKSINNTCINGKRVPILVAPEKEPKSRWGMLRSHMGIDAAAAKRVNSALERKSSAMKEKAGK